MLNLAHSKSVQASWTIWIVMDMNGKKLFLVGLLRLKSGGKTRRHLKIIGTHGI